jgi:predicted ATP-grasp superfamily ATP-dependent carboligase
MAKIPVIVAAPEVTPAMQSRYCTGRLILPPLAQREAVAEALVRAGERLVREHGAPLPLFYGDDDYLGIVQEFRGRLEPYFRLLLNEPALARALLDKSLFQALAESRGLPVPRRLEIETLAAFEAQVLVKPRSKAGWDDSVVHWQLLSRAGKAGIFESGRAALAHPAVRELADKLTFQEYIPGGDDAIWSCHGFATEESELLGWFIGRKIRTYPALTGDSSYLRLAHDDALTELGRDVVARLGLKGPFKIDFKKSAASGEFHVFEINARFTLWHYLGAANGVNLPEIAFQYLTEGKKPRLLRAETSHRWLCLGLDYRAYRELASRGKLGFAGWLASLLAAPKVCDLWAWSDPLPFVFAFLQKMKRIPGVTRRAFRWLSTAS